MSQNIVYFATISILKSVTNIINKMTQARRILLPHGNIDKVCRALNKCRPTVRKALCFGENIYNAEEASTARKIRYTAMKNYGGMDTGEPMMRIENGVMVWDYPNGVSLQLTIRDASAKIVKNGNEIDNAEGITIDDIIDWKLKAENLM